MDMDKVLWVGTVNLHAVVDRIWVQLSNPMQDYDVHERTYMNNDEKVERK